MSGSSPRWPAPPDAAGTDWEGINPGEVLDYDAESETYRASFARAGATISEAIILAVAAVTRTAPQNLSPLYPGVDPERIERLVDSSITGAPSGDLRVSFMYADCEVTVHSYGLIAVRPLEDPPIS